MDQPGYISGETLMQSDFPENLAVILQLANNGRLACVEKTAKNEKQYEAMLENISNPTNTI